MPSPNTTRFVILTLLFVVAWNFTSSLVGWGWPTATIITFGMTCAYSWYIWRHQEALLGRILLFGLAAGWTELLADRWLVDATATLVYLPGGPFVVRSPLYMPLAWMIVITQLGYLGCWLAKRWGVGVASLLIALFGAVNIPRTIPIILSMASAPEEWPFTARSAATTIRRPAPSSNGNSPRSHVNRGLG